MRRPITLLASILFLSFSTCVVSGKPAEKPVAAAAKPASTKVRYAQLVLSTPLAESPGDEGPFGELRMDLRKMVARFDRAAKDNRIQGMVLQIESPGLDRGQMEELRDAIKRFRKSGKKVYAQLETADAADYQLACACDEVVMPECGYLMIPGVRAEPMFYKGLLGKLGVEPDFIHMGDAKGAAEPYTRESWSKPVKENITALVDDLYQQLVETIALDRPITEARVRELVDQGLLTATQAKEAGLIDRIAYPAELREEIAKAHQSENLVYVQNYGRKKVDTDFSGPAGFFKLMGMIASGNSQPGSGAGKKIAVVYAVGPIMSGKSEQSPFGGEATMGSTTICEALDEANRDSKVAAIVLRVDSPGGSAVASDLMWRKIQEIDKPVIASMGSIAASGGYYISMGCDKIYAEPTAITGSIGVVGGKMAMSGLFDKLGITTDLVSRGANSGMFSGIKPFTESERNAFSSMMEETYEQFTSKVAAGRKLEKSRVLELAGGRVYTGRQAKKLGLVDEVGTLADAVNEAKRQAKLDADTEVGIITLPKSLDFFEALFGDNADEKEASLENRVAARLMEAQAPELANAARRMQTVSMLLKREPVLMIMPFGLEVK